MTSDTGMLMPYPWSMHPRIRSKTRRVLRFSWSHGLTVSSFVRLLTRRVIRYSSSWLSAEH